MNKKEMLIALGDGNRIRHKYFAGNEYMLQLPDGNYLFEDGNVVTAEEFWDTRSESHWEEDWEILTAEECSLIDSANIKNKKEIVELDALASHAFHKQNFSFSLVPYLILGGLRMPSLDFPADHSSGAKSTLYGFGKVYREVEYLHSGARRKFKKIGRNEPCPCGSGKIFKKCCIGKDLTKIIKNEEVQNAEA